MTAYILYSLAIIACGISFFKNKEKTKNALIKSVKSFENIMPQFLTIIVIVGLILAIVDTNTITKFIGQESGFLGVLFSNVVGSLVMVPTFVFYGKYFVKQWGRICPSGRISINSNFSWSYDFFTRIKIYWKESSFL